MLELSWKRAGLTFAWVTAGGIAVACSAGSDVTLGAADGAENAGGRGVAVGGSAGTQGGTSSSAGNGVIVSVGGQTSLSGQPFGCPTSLTGTVYDPAGKLPLYNVVVYVPSEPLEPIAEGAGCQTCDGNFSGRPIAAALSDAAGKFTLALDEIPRTDMLPLVIQVGKWRRQITVPVTACQATTATEGTVRLPRDRAEGNLPKIAVVRGGSDALECLFRKIGIAEQEFSTDTGTGRVHLYASDDGSAEEGTTQLASGGSIPLAGTLYASIDKMMSYDVVFLACEGGGRGTFEKYAATEFTNVQQYADRGGRIFGSHYHNYWVRPDKFDEALPPYPAVANFASSQHGFDEDVTGDVDASFPKGQALRDWLVNVGASTTPGKLLIHDGEHTVDSVIPGSAQQWITVNDPDGHSGVVQYFSFTTPVGRTECGRMVFSDLHVASGTGDSGKIAFPTGCASEALSPQEKALAFMLFDLSSCVQPEDADVVPPVVVR
jgi:hypothetical protein